MAMSLKYLSAAFALSTLALVATALRVAAADTPTMALPSCIDSASAIEEIRATQIANRKSPSKYDGYRKVLQAEDPLQLATRLAYAETLAAYCPAQREEVADLIAAVIGNRIRTRGGDVESVVFQRDQFSSSLNIYPESRYRDFLCPNDEVLWKTMLAKMRANLAVSVPNTSIPKDAVNYYLYLHSKRFTAPAWKLEEVPIANEKTRECIRVFRAPGWK